MGDIESKQRGSYIAAVRMRARFLAYLTARLFGMKYSVGVTQVIFLFTNSRFQDSQRMLIESQVVLAGRFHRFRHCPVILR